MSADFLFGSIVYISLISFPPWNIERSFWCVLAHTASTQWDENSIVENIKRIKYKAATVQRNNEQSQRYGKHNKIQIKWKTRVCIAESYISNKNPLHIKHAHEWRNTEWGKTNECQKQHERNIRTRCTVVSLHRIDEISWRIQTMNYKKRIKMKILPKGWAQALRTKQSIFNSEKSHRIQCANK